jgi:hypothetical protein
MAASPVPAWLEEVSMTSVTIQLSEREIKALKARTGKRNVQAALKAWAARANAERTMVELRAALKGSLKEEATGKGKHFRSGREAIRWLLNRTQTLGI